MARPRAPVDFTGQEPLGKCPQCGAPVYEAGMNYICEKADRRGQGCAFRTGKIILQQAHRAGAGAKTAGDGQDRFADKFISKKGRPFKAFLVVGKDGKVGFEFRAARSAKARREPSSPKNRRPKLISRQGSRWANAPTAAARCSRPRRITSAKNRRRTKSRANSRSAKTILEQPIEPAAAAETAGRRTDRSARPVHFQGRAALSAYLVMDDRGKVTFEFPPREEAPPAAV